MASEAQQIKRLVTPSARGGDAWRSHRTLPGEGTSAHPTEGREDPGTIAALQQKLREQQETITVLRQTLAAHDIAVF
jgi:hypothetical protein